MAATESRVDHVDTVCFYHGPRASVNLGAAHRAGEAGQWAENLRSPGRRLHVDNARPPGLRTARLARQAACQPGITLIA